MDTFFLNELKMCCAAINNDKGNANGISRVIEAYNCIIEFSETARSEGLLALEEACGKLDRDDTTQGFLMIELMQVIDGTEPDIVSEMGINMIAANRYSSYECLIMLMYYKGVLLLQRGDNVMLLENYLQSLMPVFLRELLLKQNAAKDNEGQIKKNEENDKWIRKLCEDNKGIDERDYSIINQTALTLLEMSDKEIQRILRETSNDDIVTAMIELPGRARARIFDNVSPKLGRLLVEDLIHKGQVTFGEVEKACVAIMRMVIKLETAGEIAQHNLTVLKFVLGVYDCKA